MFAVARRTGFHTHELKHGRWNRHDNLYLRGKTLGLLGVGSIGAETGRLAAAGGLMWLAYSIGVTSGGIIAERVSVKGIGTLALASCGPSMPNAILRCVTFSSWVKVSMI